MNTILEQLVSSITPEVDVAGNLKLHFTIPNSSGKGVLKRETITVPPKNKKNNVLIFYRGKPKRISYGRYNIILVGLDVKQSPFRKFIDSKIVSRSSIFQYLVRSKWNLQIVFLIENENHNVDVLHTIDFLRDTLRSRIPIRVYFFYHQINDLFYVKLLMRRCLCETPYVKVNYGKNIPQEMYEKLQLSRAKDHFFSEDELYPHEESLSENTDAIENFAETYSPWSSHPEMGRETLSGGNKTKGPKTASSPSSSRWKKNFSDQTGEFFSERTLSDLDEDLSAPSPEHTISEQSQEIVPRNIRAKRGRDFSPQNTISEQSEIFSPEESFSDKSGEVSPKKRMSETFSDKSGEVSPKKRMSETFSDKSGEVDKGNTFSDQSQEHGSETEHWSVSGHTQDLFSSPKKNKFFQKSFQGNSQTFTEKSQARKNFSRAKRSQGDLAKSSFSEDHAREDLPKDTFWKRTMPGETKFSSAPKSKPHHSSHTHDGKTMSFENTLSIDEDPHEVRDSFSLGAIPDFHFYMAIDVGHKLLASVVNLIRLENKKFVPEHTYQVVTGYMNQELRDMEDSRYEQIKKIIQQVLLDLLQNPRQQFSPYLWDELASNSTMIKNYERVYYFFLRTIAWVLKAVKEEADRRDLIEIAKKIIRLLENQKDHIKVPIWAAKEEEWQDIPSLFNHFRKHSLP